jgi:hypothetical protein
VQEDGLAVAILAAADREDVLAGRDVVALRNHLGNLDLEALGKCLAPNGAGEAAAHRSGTVGRSPDGATRGATRITRSYAGPPGSCYRRGYQARGRRQGAPRRSPPGEPADPAQELRPVGLAVREVARERLGRGAVSLHQRPIQPRVRRLLEEARRDEREQRPLRIALRDLNGMAMLGRSIHVAAGRQRWRPCDAARRRHRHLAEAGFTEYLVEPGRCEHHLKQSQRSVDFRRRS